MNLNSKEGTAGVTALLVIAIVIAVNFLVGTPMCGISSLPQVTVSSRHGTHAGGQTSNNVALIITDIQEARRV